MLCANAFCRLVQFHHRSLRLLSSLHPCGISIVMTVFCSPVGITIEMLIFCPVLQPLNFTCIVVPSLIKNIFFFLLNMKCYALSGVFTLQIYKHAIPLSICSIVCFYCIPFASLIAVFFLPLLSIHF